MQVKCRLKKRNSVYIKLFEYGTRVRPINKYNHLTLERILFNLERLAYDELKFLSV